MDVARRVPVVGVEVGRRVVAAPLRRVRGQQPIIWDEYRRRYLEEMKENAEEIDMLAEMVAGGKTITLLCSSACEDAAHCHRTLLEGLIEERIAARAKS